ncbi:MAG: stage II sporulation protein R [Clostridia bacterium]|nr:stage II sporulation protein R [Clostridia bacterium]
MRKILTLIVCVCVIFTLVGLLPVHGEAEIYDSVLRLHVVANSDSEADQALKLEVRDAILECNALLCEDCDSVEDARAVLEERLEEIRLCAKEKMESLGYTYDVEVRLCEEEYPTKQYGSLCFPSGEYLSLQVLIGEAAGKNWWCVLFPPLCLSAATKTQTNEDAFISVGLNPEQYRIITETQTPTYEVRFKILEALEDIF